MVAFVNFLINERWWWWWLAFLPVRHLCCTKLVLFSPLFVCVCPYVCLSLRDVHRSIFITRLAKFPTLCENHEKILARSTLANCRWRLKLSFQNTVLNTETSTRFYPTRRNIQKLWPVPTRASTRRVDICGVCVFDPHKNWILYLLLSFIII